MTREQLIEMAQKKGFTLTEEQITTYLAKANTGELAEEELDNVSGGGCYHDGKLIVTVAYHCENWTCEKCHISGDYDPYGYHACAADNLARREAKCKSCYYCKYEDALWLCYHPAKRK